MYARNLYIDSMGRETVITPTLPAQPKPDVSAEPTATERAKFADKDPFGRANLEAAARRVEAKRLGKEPSPADLRPPAVNLAEDAGPFSRARMQAAYDKRVAARQAPASATEMAEAYLARRAAQS